MYSEREIDSFVRILVKSASLPVQRALPMQYASQLPPDAKQKILTAIGELKKYRPIQYILGETEFYGLPFETCPAALIPRPETEELVDWIVRDYDKNAPLAVVDVGTGSGCIAVALKNNFNNANVWAIDICENALTLAKRNAEKNGAEIKFLCKDVLSDGMMGFERNFMDVIVSNPPYVTPSEKQHMLPNVLEYEPHCALFTPENDPMVFYRCISAFGKKCLKKGGKIFFEINEAYLDKVAEVLKEHDYQDISPRKDINDKWRMISGRW